MRQVYLMFKWSVIAALMLLLGYMLLILASGAAFAQAVPTYEADSRQQNRSVQDYSSREASELLAYWETEDYEYAGLGDEEGVQFCTRTDISVAAVLWELMEHPELIPVVETALQEYYNYEQHNTHNDN